MSVSSVLVYSREEISGDGLIKLPFVAAVRDAFPQARFSWCAASGRTVYATTLRPVVDGIIDELLLEGALGLKASDALRRPFGGRRFEVVIDTQAVLARSLYVRRAALSVFVSSSAGFRLSRRRPAVWPEAMLDRLQVLVSLAAGREVALRPLQLADARARAAAEALLPPGPTYVGFAPGAGGAERRWPLDRYLALAWRQLQRGRTPVIFAGPAEADELPAMREGCPGALFPQFAAGAGAAEVPPVLLTIALAGRLAGAVANDAGPAHMLAAGARPCSACSGSGARRRSSALLRPARSC